MQDNQDMQDNQRETTNTNEPFSTPRTPLPPYRLSLPDFVEWAYENYHPLEYVEMGHSPLWSFVRLLKGHPEMIAMTAKSALKVVERCLDQQKGRSALDAWDYFFEMNREDGQVEFMGCWERVRFVPGWEPLDQAVQRANQVQLIPPTERTAGYQQFVSIAGWLQVTMGNRNIMLPCEKLGEILSCTPMTISRYRSWGVEDGLLRQIKEHRFRPGGGGDATEFRFDTSGFDALARVADKKED